MNRLKLTLNRIKCWRFSFFSFNIMNIMKRSSPASHTLLQTQRYYICEAEVKKCLHKIFICTQFVKHTNWIWAHICEYPKLPTKNSIYNFRLYVIHICDFYKTNFSPYISTVIEAPSTGFSVAHTDTECSENSNSFPNSGRRILNCKSFQRVPI